MKNPENIRNRSANAVHALNRWRATQPALGFSKEELSLQLYYAERFASPRRPTIGALHAELADHISRINRRRRRKGVAPLQACPSDIFGDRVRSLPARLVADARNRQFGTRCRRLSAMHEFDAALPLDEIAAGTSSPFRGLSAVVRDIEFVEGGWR